MKKGLLAAVLLVVTSVFAATTLWTNDKAHSQLQFTVTHLGLSDVSGMFNDFDVKIHSTKEDFSDAVFELNAKVASIDTRVEARDNHLKSADFFDAEQYPEITYKNTSIEKVDEKHFKLTGDLSMHGITKPVTMDLYHTGTLVDPETQAVTIGFQLTGELKRSDFEIGGDFPESLISNLVRIKADGEFIK